MRRFGWVWVLLIASVGSTGCATTLPMPSEANPLPMCHIECKGGGKPILGLSHWCANGHWYRDFTAIGEYVVRGADGAKITDTWVSRDGAIYPKEDVERGFCSTVITRLNPDLALHPGEAPPSYPSSQPPPQ